MPDNNNDDIGARFFQVLHEAEAADREQLDAFAAYTESRMSDLLDSGAIPIKVESVDGRTMVTLPADILHSIITAMHEYLDQDQMIAYQASIGNAAIMLGPVSDSQQIQALATKTAFITLAVARFLESEEGNVR